jgi:hypothetical protein
MINPVNPNNPSNNSNANPAVPSNNGTNPGTVNNAAFEASILQAQGQGAAQDIEKIVQAEAARQGGGAHGHHHGGGSEAYLNGIANLGQINPPGNNQNNTTNTNANTTAEIQANNNQTILDTLA